MFFSILKSVRYYRLFNQCSKFRFSCQVSMKVGEKLLNVQSGSIAKMADGSAVVSTEGTSVLVTTVCKPRLTGYSGFMPLTVDYRHKWSAAGRIPTNYHRRDLGPSEFEILTSRMIDRSIRPLFAKGFGHDLQLTCNVLALDSSNDPCVMAINAASASLALSDVPWSGPVAAVRLSYNSDKNECMVNPTRRQLKNSPLNVVVTATGGRRVLMIDGEANDLPPKDFIACLEKGLDYTEKIIDQLLELKAKHGKQTREALLKLYTPDSSVVKSAMLLAEMRLKEIYDNISYDKLGRDRAVQDLKAETIQHLRSSFSSDSGQTQVLCTLTLDSIEAALRNDAVSVFLGAVKEKMFMLSYEFPQYANNELGSSGRSNRREMGHGALAEKALRPLMPNEFPFATRLACEVLESNGSSSMASVCAGSLALMDGGVPIKAPAAGVAIGLMYNLEEDKDDDYKILTDINGLEDYSGDMDFKIAGTRRGLTALQLDVKHPSGLSLAMVEESLQKAFVAVNEILDTTGKKGLFAPRSEMKDNGPAVEEFIVPITKRYRMMRMGGYNLRQLESDLGVQITQIDQQTYRIFAPNKSLLAEAKDTLNQMLERGADQAKELEFGAIYKTKIVEILENGVTLTLQAGGEPIFMPNSQLDLRSVKHASALGLKINDELMVKYFGRDPVTGAIRLSRKLLLKTGPSPVRPADNNTTVKTEVRESPWVKASSN